MAGHCLEHAARLGAWRTAAKVKNVMIPGMGSAKGWELGLPKPELKRLDSEQLMVGTEKLMSVYRCVSVVCCFNCRFQVYDPFRP
jgi:hypothetical protein